MLLDIGGCHKQENDSQLQFSKICRNPVQMSQFILQNSDKVQNETEQFANAIALILTTDNSGIPHAINL